MITVVTMVTVVNVVTVVTMESRGVAVVLVGVVHTQTLHCPVGVSLVPVLRISADSRYLVFVRYLCLCVCVCVCVCVYVCVYVYIYVCVWVGGGRE